MRPIEPSSQPSWNIEKTSVKAQQANSLVCLDIELFKLFLISSETIKMKKMVFKLYLEDERSKTKAMKAVAGCGVNSITVNMKKGTITAVGEADPVYLAGKPRKLGYRADLLSVGPAEEKKKDAAGEASTVMYYVNPNDYGPYIGYPSYTVVKEEYPNGCIIL